MAHHFFLKGALLVVAGVTAINTYQIFKPTFVTLDKQKVMSQFVRQLSRMQLSEEDVVQKTKRFSNSLNASLKSYATKHRVIVLSQNDTVPDIHDVTKDIMNDVARMMRGES